MRLVRLRLTDFLAYSDLDLDLDGVGQLAIIGPNGAGKSTLLDAVLWCLYGQARGRADQLIREGTTRTRVQTVWDHPTEGDIAITRTRNAQTEQSTLTLLVDGRDRTHHAIAETQVAIEDLIGLPYRALLAGPVMVQGEAGALMAATPSERKEIFVKLFELDRYELFASRAKDGATRAAIKADEARQHVGRLQETVDEELTIRALRRDAKDAITRSRAEVADHDQRVVVLREQAIALRERAARVDDLRRQMERASTALDRATMTLAELDAQAVDERNRAALAIEDLSPDAFAVLEELEQTTRAFLAAADASRIIDTVPCGGEGEFAACRFLVEATAGRASLPQLEERILALGGPKSVDRIVAERRAMRTREKEYVAAVERRSAAERWLAKEPTVRQSLEDQIETAKLEARESKQVLAGLESQIEGAQQVARDLNEAVQSLMRAQATLESGLTDLAAAEMRLKAIEDAKAMLAVARDDEQQADIESVKYRTLQRAFGRDGIPTLILENGIPAIEDRANEVLARMPGGFTVSLATQRENKSGTIRETLEVLVAADGRERPYSLLSGGEQFRVDFAIRVALSDVLVRRKGRAFQTLWLDEPAGSQDRFGREALVEAIASVQDDFGLTVVTSHIEDVTDRFETRLVITKEPGGVAVAELVG